MDVKRYFRGPFFWVALVIIGVLLVTSISSAAGGFKKVDTSVAINAITQRRGRRRPRSSTGTSGSS